MTKPKLSDEELFNRYVALGEGRTLPKLSEVTGYSTSTLQKKSMNGKWKERLRELEEEGKTLVSAFVADNQLKVTLLESEVYRGVSENLLSIIKQSMPLLKPTDNPRELKTLVDTYRLINNQPTDISRQENVSEVNTDNLTTEELADLADKLYKVN